MFIMTTLILALSALTNAALIIYIVSGRQKVVIYAIDTDAAQRVYDGAIHNVITVADEFGNDMAIDACRNVVTNGAVEEVNNILNRNNHV